MNESFQWNVENKEETKELAESEVIANTKRELTSLKEEIDTTLPFPHKLDISITDEAHDKIKDKRGEEFQTFKSAVKSLDYACYLWASADLWNKALKKSLNKLLGKKDVEKIKNSLKTLDKELGEIYKNLSAAYKFKHAKIDYVEDDWETWKKLNNCIKKFISQID